MVNESVIALVQQKLEALLAQKPEHFIVDIKIKPTNNIKVFLDGDKGVGIDELVQYNKALYKQMEEEAVFPDGDFSLEVSSPGLSEPLKLHRQYLKNTGRDAEVVLNDGTVINGKLLSADADQVVVEETKGKGKKAETIQHNILLNNIKTTKIQIKF